ncbi:hypothetical protein STEG23_011512 [Scotinomys teguina]
MTGGALLRFFLDQSSPCNYQVTQYVVNIEYEQRSYCEDYSSITSGNLFGGTPFSHSVKEREKLSESLSSCDLSSRDLFSCDMSSSDVSSRDVSSHDLRLHSSHYALGAAARTALLT